MYSVLWQIVSNVNLHHRVTRHPQRNMALVKSNRSCSKPCRQCMLTYSPATLRMINEFPTPKTPYPCYSTMKTRVARPRLGRRFGQAPFICYSKLCRNPRAQSKGFCGAQKGEWIPVFAYSCQSLFLCCTAVSPSPSSGTSTIAPTDVTVSIGSVSHTKYASYRMVNSNYVGKEAITGIMFRINYETVRISLKRRLNILILCSTFYPNFSMKRYFRCIITAVRLFHTHLFDTE
jgi:hypothetical protein